MKTKAIGILTVVLFALGCGSPAGKAPIVPAANGKMKMQTEIPQGLLTPDLVKTRLGDLTFFDGFPSKETVATVQEQLIHMRGVEAFLSGISVASMEGLRRGLTEVGAVNGNVGIFDNLMDSRSLFLTANTESVYAFTWMDLTDGPVVIESPPNVLGIVDNAWFEHVTDMGNAGPDRGKGGKFLFLPPGYEGDVPEGYHVYKSSTFGHLVIWRGFLVKGNPKPAVKNMKKHLRVYPLSFADKPPKQQFVKLSGRVFNTIHANNFDFFTEANDVIQREPAGSWDPEILGYFASIGIEKGKAFSPDAKTKQILTDAAAVANATARSMVFHTRDKRAFYYEDSYWKTGFIGGSHEFLADGVRLLDARTLFFYYATGITPAMSMKMVGVGSQYAGAMQDREGNMLDGGKTYKLTMPRDVPVKDFWSLVVYDNQTRSMLQTDQQFPSLNSIGGVKTNKDGTTDIYFGPKAPRGKKSNWIQTVPGKGWSVLLRLYGPLEPWFEKTWQPGNLVLQKDIPAMAPLEKKTKFQTEIPASIKTPDKVETRIGTLEFTDGYPSAETVALVYENLDFIRGVEAFLSGMPGASLVAMRKGFREVGITRNGVVLITEQLMDARSLYLTANTESIYIGSWLDLKNGPVVVESPPNVLGMVNDFFFRYVADLGNAGPDKGKGGKFLFLPPGYKEEIPNRDDYFVYESPTYNNLLFWRGFLQEGDPAPAVASAKETIRIYPLAEPEKRSDTQFINTSGVIHNTVHFNDFHYYDELTALVEEEPAAAFNPEILGLLAGIGMEKGTPFAPDARMKALLVDAVAVGNATARALTFHQQGNAITEEGLIYGTKSAWFIPFIGGSHEFVRNGARLLEARTMFHYPATAITPAMALKMVGVGSQYGILALDANGDYPDGAKTYKLTLPKDIPAKDFWSVVVYDPQTRSLLQTDQRFPSINSERNPIQDNDDGSTDLYFGPSAPDGKESNWVQTVPGKGFFLILRLYGPLESWFDQTWRPGELEMLK